MLKPIDIIEELTLIKFGIRMNTFSEKLLIQFVDQIIKKEDVPDYLYLEISTSSKHQIIDELENFTLTNKDLINESKLIEIVSYMFENNLLNIENTIMLLYKMNNEFDFGENNCQEIHRLDDQYHLVSKGHVNQTILELESELVDFFSKQKKTSVNLEILKK